MMRGRSLSGSGGLQMGPAPVIRKHGNPRRRKSSGIGRVRSASLATIQSKSAVPHLFDCWERVSKELRAATEFWIFLDFDGTLVRYYERPGDVKLSDKCRRVLLRLSSHRRVHLTIVSGRRNSALRKYIRVPRVKLLGLFGWERSGKAAIPRKTRAALCGMRSVLAPLAESFPGIQVEEKGISYAVHFRGASPGAQRHVRAWIRGLLPRIRSHFRVIQSMHACEIVPRQVKGKGVGVSVFTRGLRTPFLPIYVGDDLTDEPAFNVLRQGITVRVGPVSRTKARFRLKNPEEVRAFLERLEEELS
jgi:trehalose-phosphatase